MPRPSDELSGFAVFAVADRIRSSDTSGAQVSLVLLINVEGEMTQATTGG